MWLSTELTHRDLRPSGLPLTFGIDDLTKFFSSYGQAKGDLKRKRWLRWSTPNESVIHPGRLRWNLKNIQLKRKIIFQTIIFRFHVNLPGCTETAAMEYFFHGFQGAHPISTHPWRKWGLRYGGWYEGTNGWVFVSPLIWSAISWGGSWWHF